MSTAIPLRAAARRSVAVLIAFAIAVTGLAVAAPPAAAADSPLEHVFNRTNKVRANAGLAPLRINVKMNTVSTNWSGYMLSKRTLAHNPKYSSQIPSGWTRAGENVGYACGYGGRLANAKVIMQGWINSSGHLANIRGDFSDIGIGFAYQSSTDCAYATQNFGKYKTASTFSLVGTVKAPSGKSTSSLANVTVVATNGSITRKATVSPTTGAYVLSGLPKGTYSVRMKSDVAGITSEYLTDAAVAKCANRVKVSTRDRSNVDANLVSGTLADPAKSKTLCDVSTNKASKNHTPYAKAIGWVVDNGIANGYANGRGAYNYKPGGNLSRGAFAGMLYRYAGSPAFTPPSTSPFADMKPGDSNYKAVTWLESQGVVYAAKNGSTTFNPGNKTNRATMAAMLYRFSGKSYSAPSSSPYRDVKTSASNYTAMVWSAASGVAGTYASGTEFRPGKTVKRGEVARYLKRYDNKVA